MRVAVLDKKVRCNIALFKHLINQQAVKQKERFYQLAGKTYRAFLHCKSGELCFPDLEKKQSFSKEQWKPILIELKPSKGEGAFSVKAVEEQGAFSCKELDPSAYIVLTKTLHILNQLCYDPKQEENPFWILDDMRN